MQQKNSSALQSVPQSHEAHQKQRQPRNFMYAPEFTCDRATGLQPLNARESGRPGEESGEVGGDVQLTCGMNMRGIRCAHASSGFTKAASANRRFKSMATTSASPWQQQ
jgi:hypothetical protein